MALRAISGSRPDLKRASAFPSKDDVSAQGELNVSWSHARKFPGDCWKSTLPHADFFTDFERIRGSFESSSELWHEFCGGDGKPYRLGCLFMVENPKDPIINETVQFALHALKASAVVFYWVDADLNIATQDVNGLPDSFMANYDIENIDILDPLNIRKMSGRQLRFAYCDSMSRQSDPFSAFMSRYEIDSAVEMLFWAKDTAFAGMCVMKLQTDPRIVKDTMDLAAAMQPYIESNLQKHRKFRNRQTLEILRTKYGITPREMELINLLCGGKSNADISEILGIRIDTVKAHLKNIFAKTGSDNRSSLISCVSAYYGIEFWAAA